VYHQLRANTDYRVVVDFDTGPLPNDLRHLGLITPQGFDPLLTTPFRKMVETYAHFRTDRLFEVDPENYESLRLFGVRYIISSEYSKFFPKLKDNPHFRALGEIPMFFRVYEYLDARPPFSWEGGPDDKVERGAWEPEDRAFRVRTTAGGKLALHEQFFPGWTGFVDGHPVVVSSWAGAFQAVTVPAGEHTVEFRYRSRLLGLGGGISLVALIGLGFWIRVAHRPIAG